MYIKIQLYLSCLYHKISLVTEFLHFPTLFLCSTTPPASIKTFIHVPFFLSFQVIFIATVNLIVNLLVIEKHKMDSTTYPNKLLSWQIDWQLTLFKNIYILSISNHTQMFSHPFFTHLGSFVIEFWGRPTEGFTSSIICPTGVLSE